jgi:hypothetical protein
MRYIVKKFMWAWIILGFLLGASFFTAMATSNRNFVKGQYGHKCYLSGTEHGNIKYKIYFETLDECLKSLGNFQEDPDLHIEKI